METFAKTVYVRAPFLYIAHVATHFKGLIKVLNNFLEEGRKWRGEGGWFKSGNPVRAWGAPPPRCAHSQLTG